VCKPESNGFRAKLRQNSPNQAALLRFAQTRCNPQGEIWPEFSLANRIRLEEPSGAGIRRNCDLRGRFQQQRLGAITGNSPMAGQNRLMYDQ
jgi:hypothetical protein